MKEPAPGKIGQRTASAATEKSASRPQGERSVLYHTPCHDSLGGKGVETLARAGYAAEAVPHCCSEAGTLSLSRPDITDSMLHRKGEALREAVSGRPPGTVILTNCPSCVQGLGRNAASGAAPRHVAVELATRISGEGWPEAFRAQAAQAKAVRF